MSEATDRKFDDVCVTTISYLSGTEIVSGTVYTNCGLAHAVKVFDSYLDQFNSGIDILSMYGDDE